jgi:glycine hydroxymethyltransferase
MGKAEMEQIADLIKRVYDHIDNEEYLQELKKEVHSLTDKFPLYPEL